jgi:hypothetical protein
MAGTTTMAISRQRTRQFAGPNLDHRAPARVRAVLCRARPRAPADAAASPAAVSPGTDQVVAFAPPASVSRWTSAHGQDEPSRLALTPV